MNKRINLMLAIFGVLVVVAILIRAGAGSNQAAAPPATDAASQNPWPTESTPQPAAPSPAPQWSATSSAPPSFEPTPMYEPPARTPAPPSTPAATAGGEDQASSAPKADSSSSDDWLHMYAIPSDEPPPADTSQAAPQETAAQRLARKLRHH